MSSPAEAQGAQAAGRDAPNDTEPERLIDVSDLRKAFRRRHGGEQVVAVAGVDLHVTAGEFFVLLGPSGCGKTTLLRCLGGLEDPDQGLVTLAGRTVYSSAGGINLPPEKRRASMLFQSYALWPHMSVFDNVAYPLRSLKVAKAELRQRVTAALETVQCDSLAQQYPSEISGGQQQRVALARALVANHKVVLFDEPLSNVDAKVRAQLRQELREIQRRVGFAAVYVTHDQDEALELADRIAVLREGRIEQLGTGREVYQRPRSPYVARFLGSVNELEATVAAVDGDGIVAKGANGWRIQGTWRSSTPPTVGRRATVMFRPEWCDIVVGRETSSVPAGNAWDVEVCDNIFLGEHTQWVVTDGAERFVAIETAATRDLPVGADAVLMVDPERVMMFCAEEPS
ncbi:ABC transporter ATP-binding protein [Dactylosporangium salmoneum]|uniref:ABC transporter ATP-binding protein n=1 Tax=Dactylosporangium salmoneum TaxID=53361 RepID=A0ABP5SZ58_9ACTN